MRSALMPERTRVALGDSRPASGSLTQHRPEGRKGRHSTQWAGHCRDEEDVNAGNPRAHEMRMMDEEGDLEGRRKRRAWRSGGKERSGSD